MRRKQALADRPSMILVYVDECKAASRCEV